MRSRPTTRVLLSALLATAFLAGCNSDDSGSVAPETGGPDTTGPDTTGPDTTGSDTSGPDTTGVPQGDPFGWEDFGDDGSVQTGSLEVPVDYSDPSKGTFDLFVARHLADPSKRIGSLLVNPGGPGFGGSDFAVYADQIYNTPLLEAFDIIGWDPRGTGLSEPAVDCTADYDHFYAGTDITPDDDAERQQLVDLSREFADACVEATSGFLQYIGTNNSARDMDAIRQALGEAKISYFGFSYGSELGAVWATLFPDTVRAAVLDGAADPTADFLESGLQQAEGFEGTITRFLQQCADDPECAFHHDGDTFAAFDALMLALDEQPIPSVSGRPDVTLGVALTGVANAMYSDTLWPGLAQSLADAEEGDGAGLLDLYDDYYQRNPDGSYDNSLEAFQAITCMDDSDRLTVEEDDATAADFNAVAPRFAPGTTGSYFCTFFPEAADPRVDVTGAGAGPILVMGTTGDAATPLESTRAMADTLEDGRLVIVTADQHTGYGVNDCAYDVIDNYLIDPEGSAPADGTECP